MSLACAKRSVSETFAISRVSLCATPASHRLNFGLPARPAPNYEKLVAPILIVSHRLPLRSAADAFAKFAARSDGYIKVALEP